MNHELKIAFNSEFPSLDVFKDWIGELLLQYPLLSQHDADSVCEYIVKHDSVCEAINSCCDVRIGLLKTVCFEVVRELDSKEGNRRQFDRDVKILFESSNPDALSFCASVTRMLYQFRLSRTYEAKEIIAEAYTRGIRKINSGKIIDIPLAWMRGACLNVIRDFKREQKKSKDPQFDPQPWSPGGLAYSEQILKEDLLAIRTAFEGMDEEEQTLLYKRAIECLSWQEIAGNMTDTDGLPLKPGTARQRGARSVKKLRQIYKDIRDDIVLPDESMGPDDESAGLGTG